MENTNLFEQTAPSPIPFAGADFDESRDRARLTTQVDRIRELMLDGKFRTIQKLAEELRRKHHGAHFPENSLQAQLRNLKKIGYRLEKRNILTRGYLCEYQLLAPLNPGVGVALRQADAQ